MSELNFILKKIKFISTFSFKLFKKRFIYFICKCACLSIYICWPILCSCLQRLEEGFVTKNKIYLVSLSIM